jgi:hypothetical protein
MRARYGRWLKVFDAGVAVQPRFELLLRSTDLRGPLPRETVRALIGAIRSLPRKSPWPEVDEGWWKAVLSDRLLRRQGGADRRLDQVPLKSLTFKCKWCGQSATLKIEDLLRMFGPDRNVRSIGGMYSIAAINAHDAKARTARSLTRLDSIFDCHRGSLVSPRGFNRIRS